MITNFEQGRQAYAFGSMPIQKKEVVKNSRKHIGRVLIAIEKRELSGAPPPDDNVMSFIMDSSLQKWTSEEAEWQRGWDAAHEAAERNFHEEGNE